MYWTPSLLSLRPAPVLNVLINIKQMTKYFKLIILASLLFINCQQYKEVSNAQKMVDQGLKYVNSPEAKSESDKIKNEKIISERYIRKIAESKSSLKIESASTIILTFDSLVKYIEQVKLDLDQLHVTKEDERSYNKVNKYMIEEGNGLRLKESIEETITKVLKIATELNIDISKDALPLKLYDYMKTNGKTWEEYIFDHMPYGATNPILEKYKNDAILSKLMVLEKMAK